eukprot:2991308-Prymnesium_polylepis.1
MLSARWAPPPDEQPEALAPLTHAGNTPPPGGAPRPAAHPRAAPRPTALKPASARSLCLGHTRQPEPHLREDVLLDARTLDAACVRAEGVGGPARRERGGGHHLAPRVIAVGVRHAH